ncbi:hypothetical protein LXM94_03100 [Rhizobium sp. TRM95111]|uniref:hypothetical protein n=1 Tax=Rhizobium alarense TaxID=2846851 RepID=UPI001F232C46|nr:hypothetical protein [Rhizobium alarense]MCF3638954.1 hypothetical protein [Rhizobium alarense]
MAILPMRGIRQQNLIERLGFVSALTSQGFPARLSIRSEKQEILMHRDEMTIADVLEDPLIGQMMRADRVSLREMKKLLQGARSLRLRSASPDRLTAEPAFFPTT